MAGLMVADPEEAVQVELHPLPCFRLEPGHMLNSICIFWLCPNCHASTELTARLFLGPTTPSPAGECVPTLQGKFHLRIPFLGIARPQPQFPHSCVCEPIYSQDLSTYFPAAELADRTVEIYTVNLSQINEYRNWETEHYNSVLEITVLFPGIHKWKPDI